MKYLMIEQHNEKGLVKSWRLRPQQGQHSFGSSKHADIRSPLPATKGIQGFFEYRQEQWWYVSLDPKHTFNKSADLLIQDQIEFNVEDTLLKVKSVQVRENIHEKLKHANYSSDKSNKKPYQIYSIKQNGQVLETHILPIKEKLHYFHNGQNIKIEAQPSETWVSQKLDPVEIFQKTVYLSDAKAYAKMNLKETWDKDSLLSLQLSGSLFLLLFLAVLISPKKDSAPTFNTTMAPQMTYVPPKPPKKKKEEKTPIQAVEAAAAAIVAGGNQNTAPSKVTQKLQVSKLTSLIGKISSQGARTKNIVISQGIKAGSADSGRSLASINTATTTQTDWNGTSGSKGINIGTIGKGGGSGSVSGLGKMQGGNVGAGNVGLIEDEGETSGGLDKEVIANYIRSKLGEILFCYERKLSANPNLYGKVAVKFTIGPNGEVETQRVGESTLKNSSVEGCMLDKIARWNFPKPDGGTRVVVTYPFLFKSTN